MRPGRAVQQVLSPCPGGLARSRRGRGRRQGPLPLQEAWGRHPTRNDTLAGTMSVCGFHP